MSLVDLKFKHSYNNQDDNIVTDFLIPALKEAKEYDRAVGFFSSTSLMSLSVGIKHLVDKGGKIKVICSPKLSNEDYEAIKKGYDERKIIESAINKTFEEPKTEFDAERLNILSHLISNGIMDIKIATMLSVHENAMFHVKVGVIKDFEGNFVAFNGSMNDSENAFFNNGESIDVFSSFGSEYEWAFDKKCYFDKLWNNEQTNVSIIEFPESSKQIIKKYEKDKVDYDIDEKELKNSNKNILKPEVPKYIFIRDYQKEAYQKWMKTNFVGIYDMATGTGKTYTALYSIVNLLKEKNQNVGIIICCPYQHLVNQWADDLNIFNFKYILGFTGSPQKNWKNKLKNELFNFTHKITDTFCFVTTNATFASKDIQSLLNDVKGNMLLVIDEAHNFGTKRLLNTLDDRFKYRLALSATLKRHRDEFGTEQLFNYFEQISYSFPLKRAIEEGMLCEYEYYPILVWLDENELDDYIKISNELIKHLKQNKDGSYLYDKKGEMLLIQRSRIVAGARMKLDKLEDVAKKYVKDNHLLVYCGSTNIEDFDYNKDDAEDIRQIDAATYVLDKLGIKSAQFTSEQDANEREQIKKEFSDGNLIQALVAIRCLDEGVNIPSIDKAIILASSTNPKEYIQRRGRVLRKYEGKKYATIYDFVTLPRSLENAKYGDTTHDLSLVKRELVRVKDFASLSKNPYDSNKLICEVEEVYGYIDVGEEEYE